MYIPEPYYRFESFTQKQEQIITACMIAKLISYYNLEKEEGICNCKLGGGDFMLPKGFEKEVPTTETVLDNLYFIAARDVITCSFEKYLEIIRNEFSRATIGENQEKLIINLRNRVSISPESIEYGIDLGRKLLESRNVDSKKDNKHIVKKY